MLRFKIQRDSGKYGVIGLFVIIDSLKELVFMDDKRYTKAVFDSVEMAQGFMFGLTGDNRYTKEGI